MATQEQVSIKFTADAGAAQAALESINAHLEKIAGGGEKAAKSAQGIFDVSAGQIAAFTAKIIGVGSALQLVSKVGQMIMAEYENFLQRNQRAAESQITFGDAQRRFAQQLGDTRQLDAYSNRLIGLGQKTGVNPSQLGLAFSEALGGKGPALPDEAAFSAIEQAAKFMPGARTGSFEISSLAQAILTVQKGFPGTTSEEAMATIRNTMRADRATSVETFTQFLLPGIVRARGFGGEQDTFADLAPLFVGVGQRAEDPSGRTTTTNVTNFLKQLKIKTAKHLGPNASFKEMEEFLFSTPEGESIRKKFLGPLYGAGADADILEGDPAANQIVSGIVGADVNLKTEARQLIPLVEYLRGGDNPTRRLIAAARSEIPDIKDPENLRRFRQAERDIAASEFQRATRTDAVLTGTTESFRIHDLIGGSAGTWRKNLPELLQSQGVSAFGQKMAMGQFDFASATADAPDEVLAAGIAAIESAKHKPKRTLPTGQLGITHEIPLREEQQKTNEKLDELIRTLKGGMTVRNEGDPSVRSKLAAEQAGQ